MNMSSGASISSSSGFNVGGFSLVGNGAGGTVTLNATGPVTFADQGSGLFTTTGGNGEGGDINLRGSAIQLSNGASISATSSGRGNAGNITISAGNQLAMTHSSVTTEANQSSGGAIKITTFPTGTVQLTDSTISASVLDGTGGGGSVNIDPQFVLLQNSQILANAVFGLGGNINLTTNLLLPDSASIISASSQFGQQGTISIQSPISPASGKIIPLSQKPLIETSLMGQRCAASAEGIYSSFTVAGDSLPAEPDGWLSSPLALATTEFDARPAAESSQGEPAQETPILSLRRIAPPGFLIQSFATNSSTGCAS
jgi:large exoprotein involved in heme utilization and adhesion